MRRAVIVMIDPWDSYPSHKVGAVGDYDWATYTEERNSWYLWPSWGRDEAYVQPDDGFIPLGTFAVLAPPGLEAEVEAAYRLGGGKAVLPYWERKEEDAEGNEG